MPRFTHYLSLGDSMSIDLYPRLDLEERGTEVSAGPGAAALLHRNIDALWPEFSGRDLASRLPHLHFENHAVDGGTVGDVAARQIPAVERRAEAPALVTVTAGGNDLLNALFTVGTGPLLRWAAGRVRKRYRSMVDALRERLPRALLVLTTTYDPTDGTGTLPGVSEAFGSLPVQHLHAFNDEVRAAARAAPGAVLADVHRHFLGHGMDASESDRWYWRHGMIEPNARGASEIRRCWLDALAGTFEGL